MDRYNQIVPGGADRLMRLVESESEHRHKSAGIEQKHTHKLESRGQLLAFLLYLAGLGVAGVLAWTAQGASAATVATGIFASGGFLYYLKNRGDRERAEREDEDDDDEDDEDDDNR